MCSTQFNFDSRIKGNVLVAVPTKTTCPSPLFVDVLPRFATESGFMEPLARHYLTEIMDYGFGEAHRAGLAAYAERAAALGLIENPQLPEIVSSLAAPRI